MSRALKAEIAMAASAGETYRTRITGTTLAALPDVGAEYRVADTVVPGLFLRVRSSGGMRWVLRYSTTAGQRRLMTLGDPATLTPDEARSVARKKALEVANGQDPVQVKRELRASQMTVGELLDEWLDRPSARTGRPRSAKTMLEYRGFIRREIAPKLRRVAVQDVKRADVERFHRGLKDRPHTANRCLEIISAAFRFAEYLELRNVRSNPADFIVAYPEPKRRDVYVLTLEQARAYLRALDDVAATAAGPAQASACLAIYIAALRGLRIGEARSLLWKNVSDDCRRAASDVEATKTKKKHTFELPAPVAERLAAIRPHARGSAVTPGKDPDRPVSQQRTHETHRAIIERAGVPELAAARIHDFRHTFLTVAGEKAPNVLHVKDAAGHASVAMTEAYIPRYDDGVRRLVDETAAALTGGDDAGS